MCFDCLLSFEGINQVRSTDSWHVIVFFSCCTNSYIIIIVSSLQTSFVAKNDDKPPVTTSTSRNFLPESGSPSTNHYIIAQSHESLS